MYRQGSHESIISPVHSITASFYLYFRYKWTFLMRSYLDFILLSDDCRPLILSYTAPGWSEHSSDEAMKLDIHEHKYLPRAIQNHGLTERSKAVILVQKEIIRQEKRYATLLLSCTNCNDNFYLTGIFYQVRKKYSELSMWLAESESITHII